MPGLLSKRDSKNDGWTFDLHSGYINDSDSDSDTAGTTQPPDDESAFDLGSREDHAEFKKTPWTLAKLNARSNPNTVQGAYKKEKEETVLSTGRENELVQSRSKPTNLLAQAFL